MQRIRYTQTHSAHTHRDRNHRKIWKKMYSLMYENLGHSMIWLIFKWNLSIHAFDVLILICADCGVYFEKNFHLLIVLIMPASPSSTYAITIPHTYPYISRRVLFPSWHPDAMPSFDGCARIGWICWYFLTCGMVLLFIIHLFSIQGSFQLSKHEYMYVR